MGGALSKKAGSTWSKIIGRPNLRTLDRDYQPHQSSWYSIKVGDKFYDLDAGVEPKMVRALSDRYGVSPQHQDSLEDLLFFVLIAVANEKIDRATRLTRQQLLAVLEHLKRMDVGAKPPQLPHWLRVELGSLEGVRVLTGRFGAVPIPRTARADPNEVAQLMASAHLRARRSLDDTAALRALAVDLHQFASKRGETTREFFARKTALKPTIAYIAEQCLAFWTKELGHPLKVSKLLVRFTYEVYRIAGIKMETAAVKQQLHRAAAGIRQPPESLRASN